MNDDNGNHPNLISLHGGSQHCPAHSPARPAKLRTPPVVVVREPVPADFSSELWRGLGLGMGFGVGVGAIAVTLFAFYRATSSAE